MSDLNVREAQRSDFDAICSLMSALNPTDKIENIDVRRQMFFEIIDDPTNFIFVGSIDNEVITTCYLNVIPNITWNAAPYAVIENVVTNESKRRRGYGRKCIRHAIAHAFSQGCFKIILMSSQRNDRTRAFYGSVGFEQNKDGYVIYRDFI